MVRPIPPQIIVPPPTQLAPSSSTESSPTLASPISPCPARPHLNTPLTKRDTLRVVDADYFTSRRLLPPRPQPMSQHLAPEWTERHATAAEAAPPLTIASVVATPGVGTPNVTEALLDADRRLSNGTSDTQVTPDEKAGKGKGSSPAAPAPASNAPKGSVLLLFSYLQRRHLWLLLCALALSIVSGVLPPMMTLILGNAFEAYTTYNPDALPPAQVPQEQKDALMSSVRTTAWHLCALAVGSLVLSVAMISTWILVGEKVGAEVRTRVYLNVSQKRMEWFDMGMDQAAASEATPKPKQAVDVEGAEGTRPLNPDVLPLIEESAGGSGDGEAGIGSGGLTAKFARQTDDVRIATSQQAGQLVQYITTALAALILALVTCWSLALVILASIPLAAVLTIAVETITAPLIVAEREHTALASGLIDRVVSAISTVKAFNAEAREQQRFSKILASGSRVYNKVAFWWGVRLGASNAIMLAMFVQGFWYGSYLVTHRKATAGDVMTVFWACVLASSHLQALIGNLQVLEKGKVAAVGLEKLMSGGGGGGGGAVPSASALKQQPRSNSVKVKKGAATAVTVMKLQDIPAATSLLPTARQPQNNISPTTPTFRTVFGAEAKSPPQQAGPPMSPVSPSWVSPRKGRQIAPMRRIRPARDCVGEINLRNVTFWYPSLLASAPDAPPTLRNVTMFIPQGEATFIVGGSGSGKSTIAQLILRMYRANSGTVELDEQDCSFLDPEWYRNSVASVDQFPIVFDLTVHENVALGLCGQPQSATNAGTAAATATIPAPRPVDPVTHVPIVSREEVIAACRIALLHEFIKDLPNGYDTVLGSQGASLSGGQKQRLAIARARLRDPAVLILDEATSALDLTSRLLVNEAVKSWRRGKTTIIITHDLSQVESTDFLYMMRGGEVVEHGYRADLEAKQRKGASLFAELARQQRLETEGEERQREIRDAAKVALKNAPAAPKRTKSSRRGGSPRLPQPRPEEIEVLQTLPSAKEYYHQHSRQGSDMTVVEGAPPPFSSPPGRRVRSPLKYASSVSAASSLSSSSSSTQAVPMQYVSPPAAHTRPSLVKHQHTHSNTSITSMQSIASSSRLLSPERPDGDAAGAKGLRTLRLAEQQHVGAAARAPWVEEAGRIAEIRRHDAAAGAEPVSTPRASLDEARAVVASPQKTPRRKWTEEELNRAVLLSNSRPGTATSAVSAASASTFVALDMSKAGKAGKAGHAVPGDAHKSADSSMATADRPAAKMWPTLRFAARTVPCRWLLALGLLCCVIGGGITPGFSYVLGKLLATMTASTPSSSHKVLLLALCVLGLALLEGLFSFLRFTLMELASEQWIASMRRRALGKILSQDKTWFDVSPHARTGTLVARLVKDAEDARNLVARSVGSLLVVATLITVGVLWALVVGWELTLVGVALAPVFVGATSLQARVLARFEARNKARREAVAKRFYDLVHNIRGIRSMALEPVFAAQFADCLWAAEADARTAAPLSGLGFGLGEALTYLSEALMFYVGTVFIVKGTYDFTRMIVVFNLIIFAVTFAAQIMAQLPGLAKSVQATADLQELLEMSGRDDGDVEAEAEAEPNAHPQTQSQSQRGATCSERCGSLTPALTRAHIRFADVHFRYPSRADAPVLRGLSFEVLPGESVAIVGASGCGKSTVAALLQRMYEPAGASAGSHGAYATGAPAPAEKHAHAHPRGEVTFDGTPLSRMDVRHVRAAIATVSQHPDLFDGSIAENVSYGWWGWGWGWGWGQGQRAPTTSATTGPTRADVEQACRLAEAHDFVSALPRGYDTPLGEAASLISGGQKQRLAIARALLRLGVGVGASAGASASTLPATPHPHGTPTPAPAPATLLLLDEATSALDDPTRRRLTGTLLRLGVSTLLVTHKLDEMRACDKVVVLDRGRVVQVGSYEELSRERGGVFAALVGRGEWGA